MARVIVRAVLQRVAASDLERRDGNFEMQATPEPAPEPDSDDCQELKADTSFESCDQHEACTANAVISEHEHCSGTAQVQSSKNLVCWVGIYMVDIFGSGIVWVETAVILVKSIFR